MGATPAVLESLSGAFARDAAYANAAVWLAIFDADPGSLGTSGEITSGSGAAGRQDVTFNSGGSGSDPSNLEVQIAVVGPVTIPWVGFFTLQEGGTFLGGYPLVTVPRIATALNASDIVSCPAHSLAVGDAVRLFAAPNAQSASPTGLAYDTTYYVVGTPSADTLVLSATKGGSAITPSSSGGFILCTDGTRTVSGAGLLVFNIGNIIYETVS